MSTVKMGCDLALLNGNIVTMDRKRKRAEAVAVAGERIIGVGKNSGIKRLIGKNTKSSTFAVEPSCLA